MRILSRPEVFHAIQSARNLTEQQASTFLNKFCQEQPAIGQMLLSGFPMAIELQSKQMSHVFMDACFDIIYVYARVLGELPDNAVTPQWLYQKMQDMENEMKAQTQGARNKQTHLKNQTQTELLEYIGLVIDEANANNKTSTAAIDITYNMLLLVTRLFDSIYDELIPGTVH
jgi:hypothetical protein